MGRVHEFRTVLDAAEALRAQADIVFLFIGGGAQKAAVAAAVQERGLSNVLFKPYQPRASLGQSLSAADAHLVTLRPELEGLVVPSKFYGVAAVGRPTIFIGDAEGEIGSVVREAQCGMCVKQGDGEGLAGAITMLRDDSALRERMGANARRVFDERYDKAIAVAAWRRLLQSVTTAR
jgi:glycosyltransferase involved in cell wall biosynthesis